jgi:hypothetical protein
MKSYTFYYTLPLHHIAVISKLTATSIFLSIPTMCTLDSTSVPHPSITSSAGKEEASDLEGEVFCGDKGGGGLWG